jgi:HJR/Mrr/RecB family endonuclease
MLTLLPLFVLIVVLIIVAIVRNNAQRRERAVYEGRLRALKLSDVDNMGGLSFEHYVARLLKHQGFTKVEVTKASGDFGVDIVAEKARRRYAIQVKRESNNVSRRAVSDAVAGKQHYSCDAAMVVTNNYLSVKAREFAVSIGCEVVDRNTLADWILAFQSSGSIAPQASRSSIPLVLTASPLLKDQDDPSPSMTASFSHSPPTALAQIPPEILKAIKSAALRDHPNDFSTQIFVVENQRESYQKLCQLIVQNVPMEILDKIKKDTEYNHPSDYSTQLFVIKAQIEAYQKLVRYSPKGMPSSVWERVKEKSAKDHPYDYSARLFVLEEQVRAYQSIAEMIADGIPSETLETIKSRVAEDHPYDYSTQLFVIKNQIESYRTLRRLE